ncbi:MAG: Importin subunit beta-1 [Trebouxia sp. A1-2]|nr:MAG: Importin subunit beta-1 [Trebouxia sp. A1-2]
MSAGPDLTPVLQHAQSADADLRKQAELQLQAYQQQDYAGYLVALVSELANDNKPPETRQIAGLLLKNLMDATDAVLKEGMLTRWANVDGAVKAKVKHLLLPVLGAQAAPARHTAAIVVAKIAAIELPLRNWPEVVSALLTNMGQPNNSLKQATLQALGYICEEMGKLEEDILDQQQINNVLTAVAQGMRPDEADSSVRLAATVALYNALEFAHSNFDNADERNYIMQCICEGAISPETRLQEAAFECLVKVAGSYYEKLPMYIQDIFKLSHRAITQGDEEDVAKQAIEFWCTVAEEEIEAQEAVEDGEEAVNHSFIRQALQPLPNIEKKDNPENWRNREAATFAFSSILEGPSYASLAGVVNAGLGFLLNATKDPDPMVRQTTAWTIGRIFQFVHGEEDVGMPPLINPQNLPGVVKTLLESTRDEPHIAEQICFALSQLAAGFKDSDTPLFSPYFADIVQALLQQGERALQMDVQEGARLQLQAFEAINEVVRSASPDTLPLVGQLIQALLDKLASTLRMQVTSSEAKEHQKDLQGLLCGVLQVVIQKLSESDSAKTGLLEKADSIMQALLGVFQCDTTSVHEEAMLAVGALTYVCGQSFTKYMQSFYPVLELGLKNHREVDVCIATVGVLGDICRAMDTQVAEFSDNIMQVLLQTLSDPTVDRSIKPQILSSFGDIALAVGDKFETYLATVS